MTTDDDARDLSIHNILERAVATLSTLRGLSRAETLSALREQASMFKPAFDALSELHSVEGDELADRITAFVENDPEGAMLPELPAYMIPKRVGA